MHNAICLRTTVIIIKGRHDNEPFPQSSRQSFRLEQTKSLKLLSRLVPPPPRLGGWELGLFIKGTIILLQTV